MGNSWTCKKCGKNKNWDCTCGPGDKPKRRGGWSERTTGYVDGSHEVTFRTGTGSNAGHTLISSGGHQSARQFDRGHDHYGQKRENGGRVEDTGGHRGYYKGPGK